MSTNKESPETFTDLIGTYADLSNTYETTKAPIRKRVNEYPNSYYYEGNEWLHVLAGQCTFSLPHIESVVQRAVAKRDRFYKGTSKYQPHQGEQECSRRLHE